QPRAAESGSLRRGQAFAACSQLFFAGAYRFSQLACFFASVPAAFRHFAFFSAFFSSLLLTFFSGVFFSSAGADCGCSAAGGAGAVGCVCAAALVVSSSAVSIISDRLLVGPSHSSSVHRR